MSSPGYRTGRPWFLGQTPPPVEATQDELDAEGMAKLVAWLADPDALTPESVSRPGQDVPAEARLRELGLLADLEDTAPAPRGAVYRTTEGAAMPSLDELLTAARNHVMSPEEREAQRQSFTRGQLAMGSDRDEAEYRRKMRADSIDYETPGD